MEDDRIKANESGDISGLKKTNGLVGTGESGKRSGLREQNGPKNPNDKKISLVHGGDIYRNPGCLDFSANINPLSMPASVREAAKRGIEESDHYPDVLCRKLVAAIAAKEQIPEEWVICGNGAADLIFSLCLAVKPKRALLPAPTFAEYEQALRSVDCEADFYYLEEQNGFVPDESVLERLTSDTDLFFLCNPNNPTGVLTPPSLLKEIAGVCRRQGILLVSDECFLDFLEEEEKYSYKEELKREGGIFLLKAFTKIYAMPGLRLGYGICREASLPGRMRKCMQPWNVSVPAQAAGLAALSETEYVRKTRSLIAQEKEYLLGALSGLVTVYGSGANYIFFRSSETLYDDLHRKGILIRDCGNYRGLSRGYYRIAVRSHEENVRFVRAVQDVFGVTSE